MTIDAEKLKDILIGANLLNAEQFDLAERESKFKNIPLEEFLSESGYISDNHLGQIIADYYKLKFVDLTKEKISEKNLFLIPEVVAKSQMAIIFKDDAKNIHLATAYPDNYEFIKFVEKKAGKTAIIYYATHHNLKETFKYYSSNLAKEVNILIGDLKDSSSPDARGEENIVKLVNLFLEYAHENRASDIHIEPLEDEISVRFRIDGVLHEVVRYPKDIHDKIVFRIKIMAALRTDEHAASQDGRFDFSKEDTTFDVRVSVLPITKGENIVLRILSDRSRRLPLEDIGMMEEDLAKVQRAIAKPYGMILAVGPTGSGKTTTLYAIVQILNKPEVNIMSIEDPVEYNIEHVQQTQVNPKKNLTFATGLKTIVRQDPDIIMVGEIRDKDTAEIAVNAAMTGHLLLSTLHANNAATAFPRLIEMGIEPFLVASSLNVIIAQRLIRKICEQCRKSYFLTKEELRVIKSEPLLAKMIEEIGGEKDLSKIRFFKGTRCKICNNSGYIGRTGIFEVMEIGEEIRSLIVQKTSSDIIEKKAQDLGMKSMLYDGVAKVFQGITTIEEIIRVTKT
ncbi:MAG: GspE/PulE family protein [Patescibacteria group bacterium]